MPPPAVIGGASPESLENNFVNGNYIAAIMSNIL
jgi:hypothetical protein